MDFVQNYFSSTEKNTLLFVIFTEHMLFCCQLFYSKYDFSYELSKIALVCLLNIPKLNIKSLVELGRLT